jgi:hypothetical protein
MLREEVADLEAKLEGLDPRNTTPKASKSNPVPEDRRKREQRGWHCLDCGRGKTTHSGKWTCKDCGAKQRCVR